MTQPKDSPPQTPVEQVFAIDQTFQLVNYNSQVIFEGRPMKICGAFVLFTGVASGKNTWINVVSAPGMWRQV